MPGPFDDPDNAGLVAAAVQQAPSVFNSQPWSLRIRADDRIELRANTGERDGVARGHWDRWLAPRTPGQPDPFARQFTISCGAALFNLRLAVRMTGYDLSVRLTPAAADDPALLASIQTGRRREPSASERGLYQAIARRHTNRWPYSAAGVPMPIIVSMERAAAREDCWLRLLHARDARRWLRQAAEADSQLASADAGLPERAAQYRAQRDYLMARGTRGVGVPPANFGPPPDDRYPCTRSDFWNDARARPFEPKPQLLALSTTGDQPRDWLRAGQALQRAILTATWQTTPAEPGLAARYQVTPGYHTAGRLRRLIGHDPGDPARYGLAVSFLPQPLECEDLAAVTRRWPWRWRFNELPQLVIRVGYVTVPVPAAPRLHPDLVDARLLPGPRHE